MPYPIKILSQLRPILQGFRKEAGLTQAALAERLGVSQQSYAKIEANPSSVSMERLYAVFSVLNVEMTLSQVKTTGMTIDVTPRSSKTEPAIAKSKPVSAARTKELQSPRRVTPPANKKEVW